MSFLTDRERETLRNVCDTFVPKLIAENGEDERLFSFSAHDVDVAQQIESTAEQIADKDARRRFKRMLGLMDSTLVCGFMAGMWDRFSELSLDERSKLLCAWSNSRLAFARKSFQGLKRLSLFLAYASQMSDGSNPTWPVFDYNGSCNADPPTTTPTRPIQPLTVDRTTKLDADVLVVGSGAGGGVVAAELSAAGLDVLVVEKGDYFADDEFDGNEHSGMHKLYERHGSLATSDLGVVVLAGSTLGGGTTVNWMTSLRPPPSVLEQWDKEFGFTGATSDKFQESLSAVCNRLNVNENESKPNAQNSVLQRGCDALGYGCSTIPRNVKGCEQCDFCGFGCSSGAKQDVRKTYLQDAFDRGTRILVGANVDRIAYASGAVTGAEVTVTDAGGQTREMTVHSKAVVVAAGSIHTPAILLRSGLNNRHIGANLRLHPTTAVFAMYDEDMHAWQGAPQTRVCDEFADLDGNGYGVRLEVCPAHPGLSASALPWQSGRDHKHLMQDLHRMANIIVLTRDLHAGRVTLSRSGRPILDYRLHPHDAQHMMRGVVEALRIQRAAGAREVFSPHSQVLAHKCDDTSDFEGYLQQVQAAPIRPNSFGLYSAHQLSTCRISGSDALGAINPEGESYEVDNLYVADGSVLPNACGVNPMITIMGVAHYLTQQIKSRLC